MRKPSNAADAIRAINPNSNVTTTFHGDGRITYDWRDTPPISQADIDAKIVELEAEYEALSWKRSREAEYPSIQELVVALYDTDDKSAVEAKRAAVKAKYPKPS